MGTMTGEVVTEGGIQNMQSLGSDTLIPEKGNLDMDMDEDGVNIVSTPREEIYKTPYFKPNQLNCPIK